MVLVVRLPPSHFMSILFSCTLNRILHVKQLVGFFAAKDENISFVMHRQKIIRAFINWICVA